ncbi:MAG: hypothetical protein ACO39X_07065, partial [Candidatus Nanopelagicaceae bacterium]
MTPHRTTVTTTGKPGSSAMDKRPTQATNMTSQMKLMAAREMSTKRIRSFKSPRRLRLLISFQRHTTTTSIA